MSPVVPGGYLSSTSLGSRPRVRVVDLAAAPDRADELRHLNDSTWPEFLLHGDVRNWSSLYGRFSEFQLLLLEENALLAAGLTVPLAWHPGLPTPESIDEVLSRAEFCSPKTWS